MDAPIKRPWIETPLIESATLSKQAGCRIFLKLDLLQPSGSFKSRGIGNLILSKLKENATKAKNVHFYSSSGGNAGLAAVHAARDLGCACTVIVPHSTKPMMIAKLRDAGATEVIQHGASWFEADTYLRREFIENQVPSQTYPDPGSGSGLADTVNVYVPPFDHPLVWEGAGGMIAEMARQLPPREEGEQGVFPADVIVCSVGGGGLFNGVIEGLEKYIKASPSSPSTAGASPSKNVHVLAVETRGADSLAHSLRQGKLSSLTAIESQATSLGALCVAEKSFANAQSPPAGINVTSVVGSDAEAAKGVVRLADETRLQVELACGISLDVAVGERLKEVIPDLRPETRVVVVVCGGSNITAEMIAEYRVKLQDGWV
ncbi:tryptophan synthase beta subunit-like PLP-dependent enzyme [Penicillium subrubescens]|uniref:tryptophan synthase beta subunit-like PLP-dependent enzyme n=1 Tax=Penicillium subrubescens TaxID=1316194 RepID=UPI0025452681|nr:tryptophan synthase beta subunit-like PLP-dependent enzyme [Penicillium subrubescens]KAJ5911360.1 tryptophan synthase beta subunit-like PLP-dependent enzyme [Penicillium subrubescens]